MGPFYGFFIVSLVYGSLVLVEAVPIKLQKLIEIDKNGGKSLSNFHMESVTCILIRTRS